jgi:hypothetical protein
MPPERGLFESRRVSVSVSERRNAGFYAPVSASKNSVPDSELETRFDDDCVGGWQFGPFRLHHPVFPNRAFRWRLRRGPFCADFAGIVTGLSVSVHISGVPSRFLASSLCIQKFRSWQRISRGDRHPFARRTSAHIV